MRSLRVGVFALFSFLFLFAVLNPMQSYADASSSVDLSQPVPAVHVAQAVESSVVDTILAALPDWLQALSVLIAAFSGIAALTPTPKDDSVLRYLRNVVDFLALNILGAKNANSIKTVDRNRRTDSTLL